MSYLVRGSKGIGDIKYLMKSVKLAEDTVGVCTEDHWDVKIVHSLYTMVSEIFNF